MPLNLPAELISDKNDVNQTAPWLVFLKLTMPDTTEINIVNNNEDITFAGDLYTAYHFELDYFVKQSSDGKINALNLSISNVNRYMVNLLEQYDGAVGATVDIMVVKADRLASSYTDLTMQFSILSADVTEEFVNFSLGGANLFNSKFPKSRYTSTFCRYTHFKGAECKYSGGATSCDRRFETCDTLGNTENFGGFVGLSNTRVRLA